MHKTIKIFTSGHRRKSDLHQRRCASAAVTLLSSTLISLLILVPGVCAIEADEVAEHNLTSLDRLRMNLFTNYDKNSQPTLRGEPTNITLGLSVNYVDIDEMDGKVTLHCWVRVRWMDEKRSWNARDYDNITQIHMRTRELWRPDISLFNSAGNSGDYLGDTQILLFYDGSLLWVPPAVYTAYCNLNMLKWPYDKQTCKLKIGSWTLTNIDPAYLKLKEVLEYDELVQSTEWEIVDGKAHYVRKDYYNYVEFTFELQRRSSMYTAIIYTPASCIILLTLAGFWLPPQMGEKILLNGILIVVIAAYLMYFAQLLPVLAQNTPLIVVFYSACLLLLSISTMIAVTVLYLSTAKHKRRVPEFVKRQLDGKLGALLLLSNFTYEAEPQSAMNNSAKELDEHVYDSADGDVADPLGINPMVAPSNRAVQFDWVLLATALDRVFFVCYCFVFAVLAIVYSV